MWSKHFKWLALALALACAMPAEAQKTKKDKLEAQQKKLKQEIELANKLLGETRKKQKTTQMEVETLAQKIALREGLVNSLNRELDMLEEQSVAMRAEIAGLNRALDKKRDEYARLIQKAYTNQSTYNRLLFVLSSASFSQALRRMEYLRQLSQFRQRQIREIKRKSTVLAARQEALNQVLEEKKNLLNRREKEVNTLAQERKEEEAALTKLQKEEKNLATKIKNKQAQAKKLEKEIQRQIALEIKLAKERAERQALDKQAADAGLKLGKDYTSKTTNAQLKAKIDAARKKAGQAPAASTTALELTPEAKKLAGEFAANRASLPWPVSKGLIVSKFGRQNHPLAKGVIINNTGVDIATEQGSTVKAVFAGEVSGIITIPGANAAVLVRHGNYFTVYSNLVEVRVSKGQQLQTGQAIGKVATDSDGKTAVHFELWQGDQPQDPLLWLSN
jgi:septal ring factor EnvC (AmiA/AmiB activator)